MSLRISGKHMDVGDALRTRIDERISDAVDKYFGNGYSGHVTLEKQGSFFLADCLLHLDSGVTLQTSAREPDPTGSFEKAAERIEKRLRRYKRKLKDHHGQNAGDKGEMAYTIMSTPDEDEEIAEDFAPLVVAEGSRSVRTQTVAMAVMQLELMDEPVNVFRNASTGGINIVYRRSDGNVGWIDPGQEAAAETGSAA